MKKRILSILLITTALTTWWGCSSSDGDTKKKSSNVEYVMQPPSWKFNVPLPGENTAAKTAWNYERSRQYPNSMTAIIVVDSLLEPAPSATDSMAASISGEIRDVTGPIVETGSKTRFMLYIDYEAEGAMVDIHYYNSRLNKVFTITNAFNVNDDTVGAESAFVFSPFLLTNVTVNIKEQAPFVKSEGDMLAICEGDICYGIGEFTGNEIGNKWKVVCRTHPKQATTAHLYYYSAPNKAVYKSSETVQFTDGKPVTIMATFSE